ncbi:MAG: NAD(+)/NADH kinase [Spirochaetales bacterium]|nr:NAD(+)/NADH kinase [Spirochaetales bacterium]
MSHSHKPVQRVLIVYKSHDERAENLAELVSEYLRGKGLEEKRLCYGEEDFDRSLRWDLAVSLGGDGTFLFTARLLLELMVPILPIHMGTFGYITEISGSEWEYALCRCLKGDYSISRRMVLQTVLYREGKEVVRHTAINDAVVTCGTISRMIHLVLEVDGRMLADFRGDGLILATPTGSTAYSMAAGGPIVHPEMEALILTPICPFSLNYRPILLDKKEKISVKVGENRQKTLLLTIDGQVVVPLEGDDRICYEPTDKYVPVITSRRRSFLDVVQSKLGWAGGPDA